MKQINKKIALIALLSFNMMPVKAEIKLSDMTSPIIGTALVAAATYTVVTHLIHEDALVKSKYPHAQAWYDAMGLKYPKAHLETKPFLQKIWGMPVKLMSWCSTFNQIYFPQDALIRINSLYGMQLDNQTLSQEDQLYLAEQEFILLHEAGHIEHNDITRALICTAALGALTGALTSDKSSLQNQNPLPVASSAISLIMIHMILSRYHERNADAFAYTNSDDLALQGGLQFFESELVDPLFNIENKQPSPYVDTNSPVGTVAQSLVSCVEIPAFYIGKVTGTIINSTSITRWLYDAARGLTHPGGPVRAQAIRDEIARRSESQNN